MVVSGKQIGPGIYPSTKVLFLLMEILVPIMQVPLITEASIYLYPESRISRGCTTRRSTYRLPRSALRVVRMKDRPFKTMLTKPVMPTRYIVYTEETIIRAICSTTRFLRSRWRIMKIMKQGTAKQGFGTITSACSVHVFKKQAVNGARNLQKTITASRDSSLSEPGSLPRAVAGVLQIATKFARKRVRIKATHARHTSARFRRTTVTYSLAPVRTIHIKYPTFHSVSRRERRASVSGKPERQPSPIPTARANAVTVAIYAPKARIVRYRTM